MKVINREEFLKLPAGTVYSINNCGGNLAGEIYVKECKPNQYKNDWLQNDILDTAAEITDNPADDYTEAINNKNNGLKYKLQFNSCCRNGLFEEDQTFIIWDIESLEGLVGKLLSCISRLKNS